MSELLKDKLFNFEATPPPGVWEAINSSLDNDNKFSRSISPKKRNKTLFYALAVAASILLILFLTVLKPGRNKSGGEFASLDSINVQNILLAKNTKATGDVPNRADAVIHIPADSDPIVKNEDNQSPGKPLSAERSISRGTLSDSASSRQKDNATKDTKPSSMHVQHTYVTIAGPAGQPVKISSKVAALISSDDTSPEKLAWNKKILEWKNAMNSTTLAPSTSNFMDIVELTNTLTDN